jgi:hypothetical protein
MKQESIWFPQHSTSFSHSISHVPVLVVVTRRFSNSAICWCLFSFQIIFSFNAQASPNNLILSSYTHILLHRHSKLAADGLDCWWIMPWGREIHTEEIWKFQNEIKKQRRQKKRNPRQSSLLLLLEVKWNVCGMRAVFKT